MDATCTPLACLLLPARLHLPLLVVGWWCQGPAGKRAYAMMSTCVYVFAELSQCPLNMESPKGDAAL